MPNEESTASKGSGGSLCYAVSLVKDGHVYCQPQRWANWRLAAVFGEAAVKAGKAEEFRVFTTEA